MQNIVEEFVCNSLKFAYIFFIIMDRYVYDLEQNPKFLTDNQHGSNAKSKVLICNINTPLSTGVLYSMH